MRDELAEILLKDLLKRAWGNYPKGGITDLEEFIRKVYPEYLGESKPLPHEEYTYNHRNFLKSELQSAWHFINKYVPKRATVGDMIRIISEIPRFKKIVSDFLIADLGVIDEVRDERAHYSLRESFAHDLAAGLNEEFEKNGNRYISASWSSRDILDEFK